MTQIPKLTLLLMYVPVPETDVRKLKRERQGSEHINGTSTEVASKTVKIWPFDKPIAGSTDEMYGRSKVAFVCKNDGFKMELQQSLSDDDKS